MNVIEEFDGFIFDIIETKRNKIKKNPYKSHDLLTSMLELGEQKGINTDVKQLRDEIEIRAEVISILGKYSNILPNSDQLKILFQDRCFKDLYKWQDVDKSSLMTLQIREVAKVDFRLINSYKCFICMVEKALNSQEVLKDNLYILI
ncbi:hypothetical protein RhiirA1_393769 [Rhizophagus irregularis]|uniref:Uncharacterized protein n=1 Tax=Rhizophagus irregularis TaxID=588596 RepID=A0A2N0RVN6_9GLOM|nr:hypothetical protein RhiirA1_393769 [Rhizophagus irregularis]